MSSGLMKDSNLMKEGDYIVVFTDPSTQIMIRLEANGIYNHKFGEFKHSNFIGAKYGKKVYSTKSHGFVYCLKPDRVLFTQNQKHRTQILYAIDISMTINFLNIKPGSIVVESGTGSGSMSYSISKAIGDSGHLYTFEHNQERAEEAAKDFKNANRHNITVTQRDAYNDGFQLENRIDKEQADCIFIDLPSPWLASTHANDVLKHGGRLCNFSPCIEQVEKVICELTKYGFYNFKTYECLERKYERKNLRQRSLANLRKKQQKTNLGKRPQENIENESAQKKLQTENNLTSLEGNQVKNDQNDKIVENNETKDIVGFEKENITWNMGNDKNLWHTGYLTFCTKL